MRLLSFQLLVLATTVLTGVGCTEQQDLGNRPDSGAVLGDAGEPAEGGSAADAGSPPVDGSAADVGTPPVDSSAADAGTPPVDSSVADAGTPPMDSSVADACVTSCPQPVVMQIASGEAHTCARIHDGTVRCWGLNGDGQLGIGNTVNMRRPAVVPGLTDVVEIAAGYQHTCAVTSDNRVLCWGNNVSEQLGYAAADFNTSPRDMETSFTNPVTQLALGVAHSCAVFTDHGGLWPQCWGDNGGGQLGDGTTTNRRSPEEISALYFTRQMSIGTHSCALGDYYGPGTISCWGWNHVGQLGDPTVTADHRTSFGQVPGIADATRVVAGDAHTCALLSDLTVSCWGHNGTGQLGDGTTIDRPGATSIPNLAGVETLAAGLAHTCAIMDDATAQCWGSNGSGQVGDGTMTNRSIPTPVAGLTGVAELAGGSLHTCARTDDGQVLCWGSNSSGQLGDGTASERLTATPVAW